jgi:hypothetical protein
VATPEDRLGYFGPFMRAWKAATPSTHATLYTEALEYEAKLIDPRTFVVTVSEQLGIAPPPAY